MRHLVVVFLVLVAARPLRAAVLGGGLVDTDCTVGFEGLSPTDGASGVVCTDGDPSCDADGVVDGTCRFDLRVCTRLASSDCDPRPISSISISGLALDAPRAGGGPRCAATDAIVVPAGTAAGATMLARESSDLKDVDYLNLCCRTSPAPYDAARCALAISADIAGCPRPVPEKFDKLLAKARDEVARAAADPARAKSHSKGAARALRHMKSIARKLAKSDQCGDALGLVVTHAQQTLHAAPTGH
jgi:hypothetical protein